MSPVRTLLATAVAAGALLLAGQSPAAAGPAAPADVELAWSGSAPVLVDQDGRQYPVVVTTFPERQVVQDGRTLLARSTMLTATLPGSRSLPPGPVTNDTSGGCQTDGSVSVTACLTQFFTRSGGYVAVDHYAASWSRIDSQARLTKGTIQAGVLGRCRSGCSSVDKSESKVINAPANGATYTFYPSWSGIFTEVNNVRYQCGSSTLNWTRGSGSFVFRHSNVCQGSIP